MIVIRRMAMMSRNDFYPKNTLTINEINFFKRNGYVVKRQILDPDLMDQAIKRSWSELPTTFSPNEPGTWKGDVTDSCMTCSMIERRGVVKLRNCLWSEEVILEMYPRNPTVFGIVEQLLGSGNVAQPMNIRGVYLNFPIPEIPDNNTNSQHYEKHSLQLGTTAYLDDVVPGGGEFVVYPKSHIFMNYAFKTRWNDDESKRVKLIRRILSRVIRPVRLSGKAGDVIFWHHRLLHGRNINSSSQIRYAAVCDFCTKSLEEQKTNMEPWNTYDLKRPSLNMWKDWAI